MKSTEKFIEQANKVHNFKYNYDKSVYLGDKVKLSIVCFNHGEFFQTAGNHLANHGCRKCRKNRTLSLENVLNKFKKVHENMYDYSKFNYITSKTKSTVICKIHGEFQIEASSHLQGVGCKNCGIIKQGNTKRKTLKNFLTRANLIHKNKYNYSLVNYNGCKSKVSIICNNCKVLFLQTPNVHLNNKGGCKNCGNSNNYHKAAWIKKANGKEGIFYIIKCFNKNEEFFKFGITFRSIYMRYNKQNMPYNYEIIKEVKSKDLSYVWDLEKRFKNFKKNQRYKPLIHFLGDKYECFKN